MGRLFGELRQTAEAESLTGHFWAIHGHRKTIFCLEQVRPTGLNTSLTMGN
jgi:hypothetical protein